MPTKIFLDSGVASETKEIKELLGFLDGQTTNPTLIAKHPLAKARFARGDKFTSEEIIDFYRQVISEVSALIPHGSVSIEVYSDQNTTTTQMIDEAHRMNTWIPNAHIKLPITAAGLAAAEHVVVEGIRVNMTLCFTQQQAAAVYAATRGAQKGQVFVSPFIGRLDDVGVNGMDVIKNCVQMFREQGDGHVEVLTASVRSLNHLYEALRLQSDIITAPLAILTEWKEKGIDVPADFFYDAGLLTPIAYESLDLTRAALDFDIHHELTDRGIQRFSSDWNELKKYEI